MDLNATVTLPLGYWHDNAVHRTATLRALSGADQEALVEADESTPPARFATALIARGLVRLGPVEPVSEGLVRGLSLGDREALLLHLRRLTFGERVSCVLECPAADCGAKMDLDLTVGTLLLPPNPDSGPEYEADLADGAGVIHRALFRLPTGADQETAAELDPEAGARLILARCVRRVTDPEGRPVDGIPAAVAARLPALLSELDPQAELRLELRCPECERPSATLFDTAAFFRQELVARAPQLYREVHRLASHYHWGEREIMGMSPRKRRRYLDLLEQSLEAAR